MPQGPAKQERGKDMARGRSLNAVSGEGLALGRWHLSGESKEGQEGCMQVLYLENRNSKNRPASTTSQR